MSVPPPTGPIPIHAPLSPASPSRVVAIGASAGGLESLQQLFAAVPGNTGMAFVVVQHLSPDFKSLMPELLGRQTRMPLLPVDRDLVLRPDTVYVLSAGFTVALDGDRLVATPRGHEAVHNLPINRLFESMQALGPRAAVVVLSGTGQDGMVGARAVKQAGGLVLAQVPASARFDSMPRAVIDAGLADVVALPSEVGRVLLTWQNDPEAGRRFLSAASEEDSLLAGAYGPVLNVLQRAYDLDFGQYKSGTIVRRIDRWLNAAGRPLSPVALAAQLEGKPAEIDRLFGDLLIGVTSFFRDPEAFEALRLQAIEPMIDALGERDALRIWCCGCSTGEEAYTVAILALEAFDRRGLAPRLRVLATDAHPLSVQRASSGIYTEEVMGAMPAVLRGKYFAELPSGHLKVAEHLRRHVVFSVQNVLKDAGFQHIDIVCCRNLLIYLRPSAQAQALASFHIALHAGGMLMLGKSEMPSEQGEAFMAVDDSAHLYRKRPGLQLPLHARPMFSVPSLQRPGFGNPLDHRASFRLQEVLAQRYVPSGFLVNQNEELAYVFGDAGRHLRAASGRFGGTLFNLLAGPLRTAVTVSLRKAAQSMTSACMDDVVADEQQPELRVRVEVDPIADRTLPHHYFMVRIGPMQAAAAPPQAAPLHRPDDSAAEHIAELEAELVRTREALQRSVEDLEAANEELQAGNEELMAANEELQSSNEELHALNEELYSVNTEHELKIQELRDTTADLNNLIDASELALIFLDLESRLRLFTPPATRLFPLRPEDTGRELRDLVPREADPRLFDDLARALTGEDGLEQELTLSDGRIMRRRVSPYRSELGVTSGLVITYLDITQQVSLREQQARLKFQAQLQAMMEALPHLVWTCTPDGRCDFVNPQWTAYTGQTAAQQHSDGWLGPVHPHERADVLAQWNEARRQARPLHTRLRLRRHDGAWRWFDLQCAPQRDAQGQLSGWFGSCSDLHETVLLQQALERRQRFAQLMADNIQAAVSGWDHEGRHRFANRQFLQWHGRGAESMNGLALREVLGEAQWAQVQASVQAALAGRPQRLERSCTRADGRLAHLQEQYVPHEVDGEVQGLIITSVDITPVQEARMLADRVFDVSPLAKLVFSQEGRLTRWNQAARQLLGYSEERLRDMPLEMLVPQSLRQRHNLLHRAYMAAPEHRPMGGGRRFPLVRGDGSVVEVDIDLSSLQIDGSPAALAMVRETGLSEQARQQLDLALKARSRFLAQMSHEIRTPLNAILGMAQLLEMEQPTPKQLDRLRRIEEASTLLLGIVNDVLDLAKMEAGKLVLAHEPFRIATVLDHCVALVSEKARLKQLALQVEEAAGMPKELRGDARRIEQILVNLLSNAVKFTSDGQVQVRASCAPASDRRVVLRVEVADSGIGIAPEELARLFEPFQQVQSGHTRRFGGTGLGLSICRQLARAMNGDCGATSTPGLGSCFWFTALLEVGGGDLDDGIPAPPRRLPVPTRAYAGKKVLVVEDNAVNRAVIVELLQGALGVQPTEAVDGHAALALARQARFDLVLMDVQMPGMDGLETTRQLRRLPGWADTPIYALTANVQAEDVNACLASGMNGHFGKPVSIEVMVEALQGLWGPPPATPPA